MNIMNKTKDTNSSIINLKESTSDFFQKHNIELVFIAYWIILMLICGIFFYLSIKSTSYANFYSYLMFSIIIFILGLIGHRYFNNYIREKSPLINLMTTIMLIIVSLSGLFTYLIMLIFTDFIERLPNFRFIGEEGDWINFIGIIIAGLITMLGITITINYQQKVRDDDLKNQLLPLVEINLECYSVKSQQPIKKFQLLLPWILKIQNIGDNPVRNLKVYKLEACFFNNELDSNLFLVPIFFENIESLKTNLIAMNKIHEVEIQISPTILPKVYYKYLRLYFYLDYYDLTLKNIHSHRAFINLELTANVSKFETTGYRDWNLISIYNQFIN